MASTVNVKLNETNNMIFQKTKRYFHVSMLARREGCVWCVVCVVKGVCFRSYEGEMKYYSHVIKLDLLCGWVIYWSEHAYIKAKVVSRSYALPILN